MALKFTLGDEYNLLKENKILCTLIKVIVFISQ